jgi:hypothetical protein
VAGASPVGWNGGTGERGRRGELRIYGRKRLPRVSRARGHRQQTLLGDGGEQGHWKRREATMYRYSYDMRVDAESARRWVGGKWRDG